jgi:hypothetical protein
MRLFVAVGRSSEGTMKPILYVGTAVLVVWVIHNLWVWGIGGVIADPRIWLLAIPLCLLAAKRRKRDFDPNGGIVAAEKNKPPHPVDTK